MREISINALQISAMQLRKAQGFRYTCLKREAVVPGIPGKLSQVGCANSVDVQ